MLMKWRLNSKVIFNFIAIFLMIVGSSVSTASTTVSVDGKSLVLNGMSVRKQLSDDFYIGALYLQNTSNDPATILSEFNAKRMEVRFVADRISATRFGRLWAETIRINNDATSVEANQKSIIQFMDLFTQAVQKGDQFTFDYVKGKGVTVKMNTVTLGRIKSDGFMSLLVSTWIGDRPPSMPFKKAILGVGASSKSQTIIERFSALKPSNARIAQVKTGSSASSNVAEKSSSRLVEQPNVSQKQKKALADKKAQEKARKRAEAKRIANKKAEEERMRKEFKKELDAAVAKVREEERQAAKEAMEKQLAEEKAKGAGERLDSFLTRKEYEQSLIQFVSKRISYPPVAYKKGIEGSGILRVKLSRDGQVSEVQIDKSTRSRLLDKEAVKAIKQLSPLPSMPKDLPGTDFEFLAPVNFKR